MATTLLRTSPFHAPPSSASPSTVRASVSFKPSKPSRVSFTNRNSAGISLSCLASLRFNSYSSPLIRCASEETETTETSEEVGEPEIQEAEAAVNGVDDVADTAEDDKVEETEVSAVLASLQAYREAFANNDESKIAEIEAFLKSIEDEKSALEQKVASLTDELSTVKDRIIRISADFDNFRKRTERDRLSLVTNAQGEVVENLLPVLDNFERAKTQIKVETEGEEKIVNSYQSIYKQFVEIMTVLGVVTVETIGKPFDPMLHEAIMREDSTEFEEGVVLEEYRKGFKLGDRLLRPAMVKVSSGPGPAKTQQTEEKSEEGEDSKAIEEAQEGEDSKASEGTEEEVASA